MNAVTKISLSDFITLQRGFDLPTSKRKEGSIPIVASRGVVGHHNEPKVKGPGVVIGRSGSIGGGQYIEEDYWPLNTTLWVKDFKGNNPRFTYYLLKSIDFSRFNAGSGVPTLNRNHIASLQVSEYERKQQDRIVEILSTYDDLIENNLRRIQLLEEVAQLLYKEWFVHLRYPGHEHVRIVDGLPEGWDMQHLANLLNTQYGFTETAAEEPVGPHFLRGTDINKTSYIDWSTVPYCPDDKLDYNKYALNIGDILVIRMADPGKVAIVENDVKSVFASYLVRLTRKEGVTIPPLYLFYVLSDNQYQGFISGASGGSTRKSASAKLLVNFDILVPSTTILSMFIDQIQPIRSQIQILLQQNANLRKARDLLLPRLMNGEVTV